MANQSALPLAALAGCGDDDVGLIGRRERCREERKLESWLRGRGQECCDRCASARLENEFAERKSERQSPKLESGAWVQLLPTVQKKKQFTFKSYRALSNAKSPNVIIHDWHRFTQIVTHRTEAVS